MNKIFEKNCCKRKIVFIKNVKDLSPNFCAARKWMNNIRLRALNFWVYEYKCSIYLD